MGSFREKGFWLASGNYTQGPALDGEVEVDVAIVGGGFTGLSTAYHLKQAEPSLSVALLEQEVIGYGASGRNGGFSMTLFGLTLSVTALRFGRAKALEAHRYMEQAVDHLQALVETLPLDCDYAHPGFLRVATSPAYEKRIQEELELALSLGIEGLSWLDADHLAEEVRSPLYRGAWWEPRSGLVNPAKLARAWRAVILGQGILVFEGTPVRGIRRDHKRIHVDTPRGVVHARKVVLATNAWSHLIPGLKRKQVPAFTHIVLTEPLSPRHFEAIGWRHRQGIEDARNLVHYYRLTADDRLLMGGRTVGIAYGRDMDRDLDARTFARLEADVGEIFPALADIRFTHRWGGPVSIPLDLAPVMGFVGDPRVVFSLGAVGHGVALTHMNGWTLSDLVREEDTERTHTFFVGRRAWPWPPEPLRFVLSKAIKGALDLQDVFTDRRPMP